MNTSITITDDKVISRIYLLRGKRVMLDKNLAELYQVETKVLNQAVRRNQLRFLDDFMFQLNNKEWELLKSQFVTSSWGGRRTLPYAFTEQGVAMLSSVLKSDQAIHVNIQVIRVFIRMREMVLNNKGILLKLEQVEKKLMQQDAGYRKHEQDIQGIFEVLKQLIGNEEPPAPRKRIGFKKD